MAFIVPKGPTIAALLGFQLVATSCFVWCQWPKVRRLFPRWVRRAPADVGVSPEVQEQVAALVVERRVSIARNVGLACWGMYSIFVVFFAIHFAIQTSGVNGISLLLYLAWGVTFTMMAVLPETVLTARTLPAMHLLCMVITMSGYFLDDIRVPRSTRGQLIMGISMVISGICLSKRVLIPSQALLMLSAVASHVLENGLVWGVDFQDLLLAEIFAMVVKLSLLQAAEAVVISSAKQEVQAKLGQCHEGAISSLLSMMCDAVVDLDKEFRLKAHFPKLSGLLIHGTGRSLQGDRFAAFVQEGIDRERVEELVQRSRDAPAMMPNMLTVRLRDSLGGLLKVALYHVPYFSISGHVHHMVGLRDDPDVVGGVDRVPALAGCEVEVCSRGMPAAELQPHIARRLRPAQSLSRNTFRPSGHASDSSHRSSLSSSSGRRRRISTAVSAITDSVDGEDDMETSTKAVAVGMALGVYMTDGLPVQWVGKDLAADGLEIDYEDDLEAWLQDGERLHKWLQNTMNDALHSGRSRSFTRYFGPLSLARPGTAVSALRNAWVYFPAPLEPEEGCPYSVVVGLAHVTAEGADVEQSGTPPA